MLRNYLTAALRNLVRNRLYAAINIAGLAVGFAAALLIAMFVRDELSYDRYFVGYDNVYLMGWKDEPPGRPPMINDTAPTEFAAKLLLDFPFAEAVARINPGVLAIRVGDVENPEPLLWADSKIIEILKFKPVAGDLKGALTNPDSIILTRTLARKYFGSDNALGKALELKQPANNPFPSQDEPQTFTVTAVIEDLPYNVHLRANAIVAGHGTLSPLARQDATPAAPGSIMITGAITYLKLADEAAAQRIADELPAFLQRHKKLGPNNKMALQLKPLATLHFAPGTGMKPRGSMDTLWAMGAIGILIVVTASINFVNLMTARATRRAVEVGVRKAAGAARRHLVMQFIGESVIYVVIGVGLGLALAAVLLPSANAFLRRDMHLALVSDPMSGAFVVAMAVLVGMLAGLYPAFVLASFRPAVVLKAAASQGRSSAVVRQSLVVLQFALLIGLVIASGVVHRQIDFALTEGQRLDTDEVVIVSQTCRLAFKEAVTALPGVRATTCSTSAGINPGMRTARINRPDGEPLAVQMDAVDPNFFEFYGLKPVAGRFFDGRESDAKGADAVSPPAIVINEAMVSKWGFESPQAAIGQTLTMRAGNFTPANSKIQPTPAEIIGVVPDFNADPIRTVVSPGFFYVDPEGYSIMAIVVPPGGVPRPGMEQRMENGILSVRLDGPRTPETLQQIDKLWKDYGHPRPIFRFFLSQNIQARYADLTQKATMFAISAGVAIFIALLGLFGVAAFTAERRTKEIGIRKAMGASRGDVLRLLLWQFSKPVLWANLIAWPVAGYFMQRWLQGFINHVDLEPWVFLAASAAALVIAMLTVLGHAILAARARPAAALRYE